jgi:hypothetical protein
MLYVCGRFKERKGDDYCDPATIERDELEDDGSKQVEKVACIGGGGFLRKHWSMLVGSHPTFSAGTPSILSSPLHIFISVSPIIQH